MKSAGERTRYLTQKEEGVDSMHVIDLPASFDGSWCLCRWTANRGIASSTAEVSNLKLWIFPINGKALQSSLIEECKKNGKVPTIEYLAVVIKQEPIYFKNHFASPQVNKLFHFFPLKKRNSFPF